MPNPFLILSFVLLGILLLIGGYFFALVLRRLENLKERLHTMETTLMDTHTRTIRIESILTPEPGLKTVVTIAETPKGVKTTTGILHVPRDMGEEARQARDKDRVRVYPDGYTEIRREE